MMRKLLNHYDVTLHSFQIYKQGLLLPISGIRHKLQLVITTRFVTIGGDNGAHYSCPITSHYPLEAHEIVVNLLYNIIHDYCLSGGTSPPPDTIIIIQNWLPFNQKSFAKPR